MLERYAVSTALLASVAFATLFVPAEALAKHRRHYRAELAAPAPPPPKRYCRPDCDNDRSPCDPYIYKRADGRCNFDNR